MAEIVVTDEAVEAGGRALLSDSSAFGQEGARDEARAVLEAAAPLLQVREGEVIASAIEDAADALTDERGMPAEGYYAAAKVAREFTGPPAPVQEASATGWDVGAVPPGYDWRAAPQVDREALERVLRDRMLNSNFTAIKHEPLRTQVVDQWVQVFTDAVLALLSPEEAK